MTRAGLATVALGIAAVLLARNIRLIEEAGYYVEDALEHFGPEPLPESGGYMASPEENVSAFLALIRRVEAGPQVYHSLVGGGAFRDMTDHPALTGEFAGIRTADGRLTTAAGAYQITRTTWKEIGGAARFGDFSPAAQDAAAVAILQEKRPGAYRMIEQGRFLDAIKRLRNEWEAFDKMLEGNYFFTLDDALTFYQSQGGSLA